jgi:hypothetical protein
VRSRLRVDLHSKHYLGLQSATLTDDSNQPLGESGDKPKFWLTLPRQSKPCIVGCVHLTVRRAAIGAVGASGVASHLAYYWVVRMSVPDAIHEKKGPQRSAEPLLVALEHIEVEGSLFWLVQDRAQRLDWMKVLTKEKLVVWNARAAKYELTPLGGQCLAEYRQTTRMQPNAAVS